MKAMIAAWLIRHRIAYDHIHDGPGKPPAHAYIDDKAVSCRPEYDGPKAFDAALSATQDLL